MSGSEHSSHRFTPEQTIAAPRATAVALPESAVAGVTGWDGALIAAVRRHVRPAGRGRHGPEVVVTVQGDLDLDSAPVVEATVLGALDTAPRVCLDLSEATFFGAAGVRVIIAARQHAESRGRVFRLSGVHGITERVLALVGLSSPA